MNSPAKMLKVFLSQNDMHGDVPLYEAVVRRMVQLDVRGATVDVGVMGFGSHHKVHHKRLFGVADDRPVTITVIDSEEKLRKVAPEIRKLVPDGILILTDAEVL
jgi:PII-like signaling protein